MRSFFIAFTSLMLLSAGTAQAKVDITVDKDNQQMTVMVDGVTRYHWPGNVRQLKNLVERVLILGAGSDMARETAKLLAAKGRPIQLAGRRPEALARLNRALGELIVDGVDTTVPLFHALLREKDIHTGEYNIHWLEKWLEAGGLE